MHLNRFSPFILIALALSYIYLSSVYLNLSIYCSSLSLPSQLLFSSSCLLCLLHYLFASASISSPVIALKAFPPLNHDDNTLLAYTKYGYDNDTTILHYKNKTILYHTQSTQPYSLTLSIRVSSDLHYSTLLVHCFTLFHLLYSTYSTLLTYSELNST